MGSIRHAFCLATIAIAVAVSAAIPASALASGGVETGTFPVEDHFVDQGASDACGFPVSVDLTGRGSFQVRFDGDGNPTDVTIHVYRTGTMSGNGVTLSEFDRINLFIDLTSGEQRDAGIEFRVSAAGSAPAIFDRGRLVFDGNGNVTFDAGPHPALDGDFSGLCAALGA